MATKLSVNEVLDSMTATKVNKDGEIIPNRFNKKDFTKLLKAMMNDPKLTTEVAKVQKKELQGAEEIAVGEGFRKWCRNLVEKAGIDPNESAVVMTDEFQIDNADGIYDFIATALWLYMERGNLFQLMPKDDFQAAQIGVKTVKEKTREYEASNPKTREKLGVYEQTNAKHRELYVKDAGCPSWLQKKKKKG